MKQSNKPIEMPGWVYIVRIVNGPTKIGLSTKGPDTRVSRIAYTLPYEIEYLAVKRSDDVTALESKIHAELRSKFIKNEWFDLSQADIDALIKKYGFLPPDEAMVEDVLAATARVMGR